MKPNLWILEDLNVAIVHDALRMLFEITNSRIIYQH